jgi:hypothetical protein
MTACPEHLTVELLAHDPGADRQQPGHLCADQPLSLRHVQGPFTGHPDVDVHAVLGGLSLGRLPDA